MSKKKGPRPLPLFDSPPGPPPGGPPPLPPTPSGKQLNGDITRHKHRDNQESREAYESLQPEVLNNMRLRVYNVVRARGLEGATTYEITEATGMRHQTVSARASELRKTGYLVPTKARRPTSSGRPARVLIAYEYAGPPT